MCRRPEAAGNDRRAPLLSGLVVTRYHIPPRPRGPAAQRIELVEGRSPRADAAGLLAAGRMLALTQG